MRDLYSRRERGEIQAFRRLAVETTGLTDPRADPVHGDDGAGAASSLPARQRGDDG
jgi:hypothetical protein